MYCLSQTPCSHPDISYEFCPHKSMLVTHASFPFSCCSHANLLWPCIQSVSLRHTALDMPHNFYFHRKYRNYQTSNWPNLNTFWIELLPYNTLISLITLITVVTVSLIQYQAYFMTGTLWNKQKNSPDTKTFLSACTAEIGGLLNGEVSL